jgi:hypothetical protein
MMSDDRSEGGHMSAEFSDMPPLLRQMQSVVYGLFRTQAVSVAASLGIADILSKGPAPLETIARATSCHQRSLGRLMRFLVSEGIFSLERDGRYGLTPLGDQLRSDQPVSNRRAAIFYGSPPIWAAWGKLAEVVRTGRSGFELAHGEPLFEYAAKHADFAAVFNDFMSEMARPRLAAAAYDFSGLKTLVDVGGGDGTTLAAILGGYPGLQGVLFDLPAVVSDSDAVLRAAGVADRCRVVAGDFFESVPEGGDAYLLSNILHDWDDDRCAQILSNCRGAMATGSKLLIVEAVVPEEPSPVLLVDMQMMVVAGGVQRTASEFKGLLEPAGFANMRAVSPGLIEAVAV